MKTLAAAAARGELKRERDDDTGDNERVPRMKIEVKEEKV